MSERQSGNPAGEIEALAAMFGRWLDGYRAGVSAMPVRSQVRPGEVVGKLPQAAPETGFRDGDAAAGWAEVLRDLDEIVVPGLTHWQHPRFFGYFPANASVPAMMGELVSAGLGVQGMLWLTSPACTEIETRVLDWLREMLGLPECFDSRNGLGGGVIQGTASEATLTAMVAARDRVRRWRKKVGIGERGEYVVYASGQAHSSVLKAAMIAGIADGPQDAVHVRMIDVDGAFAMRRESLAAAMREDLAAGRVPCFVCSSVGTTGTTAVDPTDKIAATIGEVCGAEGDGVPVWLHVDAAHAGSACVAPEFRWMLRGVERADSFCFNPHKWLLTNFDCDCFYLRDRRPLIDAMSVTPEYLRNTPSDSGEVIDYRDWQVPLGRRFRALKLWFVIRAYGVSGLREHVRRTVGLAALFESLVRADGRFEIVAPRVVNLVCFRLKGSDGANQSLMERLNATGRVFLSHTMLASPPAASDARYTIRVAVGTPTTSEADIRELWARVLETALEPAL
ncbi:MAG: pyridoxal-dependent decarboxylase [Planctomycetota bacterium]